MNESQSNFFLAEQPVGALMRKFSLPCILSLLVGALYNIVDQLFIANASYLGSYGNAANSVVFPLTVIALAIATMIGDGCCAYVSIRLGAGEQEQAHRSVGNAIVLTLIVSVVLMAVYLIFMDPILTAFGATVNAETFALSREYCFWIALGIPFYMFGQAMNPIIRSDGSPRYAMLSLLAGAVCNIILDPIFIFPCGWGMMGAAVATVIGQILSAVLAAAYLLHMKAVRLQRGSFRLRGELLRAFLPLGMTSFLSQISIVFSMAAVLNMCRKYGALDPVFGQAQYAQIPTAVVGIVMKFFQIVISIAIGLSAGCIPVVGYNIGAGRRDRARALLHRLMLAEAVVGLVATALFESCPGVFADLFGAKNESAYYTDFAVRCIRWFLGAAALSCVNKGAMIYLQSLGKAWTSTALSLLREIVLGVGLAVLMDASETARKALYPLIIASQTIPTTALAPLFVLWFGYTIWSKVLVTVLITFFPITITVFDGFRSVKTEMEELLFTFGADKRQIFLKLKIPATLPYFFSAIKMAVPLSIIGAAIGEWLGAQSGLGYFSRRMMTQLDGAGVFAPILLLSVVAMAATWVVSLLEKRMIFWRNE